MRHHIELIVIGIFSILLFFFLVSIDAFELFAEWSRQHEEYELDEAILLVPVYIFAISVFGYRKFKQVKQINQALQYQITKRELTEIRLKESEHRLLNHLNKTPVGVVSMDLEFKVTEWNPAAENIFGYKKNEAIGRHITELVLQEELMEMLDKLFKDLMNGSGGERNVNENITKTGKTIICDWYNTLLRDFDDKVVGMASLVNDITDKKRAEELLIQSEKMLSIGGLAAGMAHEINNPLAGMIQNAQVIQNRLTKKMPANDNAAKDLGVSMDAITAFMEKRRILTYVENIHQAGIRVAQIINNMLSFARKSDANRREINLEALIDKTIELTKNDFSPKKKYDFKQVEIIREFNTDIPKIFCEESKIQQVLFNIIKNASEAMSTDNSENKKPRLILRLLKTQRMVCIEIEDNGPGMDEETHKQVFEPFFTTKSFDKGTGLGLSVSYFIVVDDHGGEMEVNSVLGEGTKFSVSLPFRSEVSKTISKKLN